MRGKRLVGASSLLGLGIAVAAGLMILPGMGGGAEAPRASAEQAPPEVSVATVVVREITEWQEYTGRLAAVDRVEVRPRVAGQIERVRFEEGARVAKGDVLFEIDPRPFQAALDRARARLAQARTERAQAAREAARAETLFERRVISKEEYEVRVSNARASESAVKAAEAAVTAAALDVEFTRVTAPVAGRVGRAEITQGNWVTPGGPRLTTLVSTDPLYVDFVVDERTYLTLSQRLAEDRALPVRFALTGEDGFDRTGRLTYVGNQVDAGTGTLSLRAVVPNPDGMLRPGLFARVQLPGRGPYRAVLVNDRAIGTDQGQRYVLAVDDSATLVYRGVALGPKVTVDGQDLRVVRSGLRPGEAIVVKGLMRARPGLKVAPQAVAMDTLAPLPTALSETERPRIRRAAQGEG